MAKANEQETRERYLVQPAAYTLEEVGKLMNLTYASVWGHFSAGSLPWEPLRIGRKVFFRRSEVNRDLGIEEE